MGEAYRVHITIRRKGKAIFTSVEYKTELVEDMDELTDNFKEFVSSSLIDDQEGETDE